MDREKLLKELEAKKRELEELEKALKETEEKPVYTVDPSELLKEIKDFPRYYMNSKGEIFHESGITLPIIERNNKKFIKIFDSVNNLLEIDIEDLIKNNF